MKKVVLATFLIALTVTFAFMPKAEDPLDRLVASLEQWAEANVQEKVYLHTDRSYYAIGDTLWFKGYVTIGSHHQLSAKSGALYVELISPKDSVMQMLKLPVTAGMVKGNFIFSPDRQEGNYRLRAYTQWMRNAGPDYFYDKTFLVKNAAHDRVFSKIDFLLGKEGSGQFLTALINYTDSLGRPLTRLSVKYSFRKNYNTISRGQGTTDEKGTCKIELKGYQPSDLKAAHLVTSLELEDLAVVTKSFPVKMTAEDTDIRFFPEGGELLADFESKIAFKITAPDGLGKQVKGVVTDENDKEVAAFESNRFGIGCFTFRPRAGKQYRARFLFADGSLSSAALPPAVEYGYALSADYNTQAATISIGINRSLPYLAVQNEVFLLIQSGGAVYYSAKIPMKGASAALKIPAGDLPSGIAQLTLFSATGEPLNERIIFIMNKDQLQVSMQTRKQVYATREKVTLDLEANAPGGAGSAANFSISVVNEDLVPTEEVKENTIFSHLLLSSDLRGYIEQPNYYFHNPSPETRKDLDLLMLTQGYRRFAWKDLNSGQTYPQPYPPETLITEVSGRLVNLWRQRVPFGTVYMLNNKINLVMIEKTDAQGRFKFKNLVITEGLRFSVHGRKRNNGQRLEVLLDKFPLQKLTPNTNLPDAETDLRKVRKTVPKKPTPEEEAREQARRITGRLLKEVKIKARPVMPGLNTIKGYITETIIFNEQDSGKTIFKALKDRNLQNMTFQKWSAYLDHKPMGVLINDRVYRGDAVKDVFQWDVEDAVKVDIVRESEAVRPTLFIYTRSIYVAVPIDPLDPYSENQWNPQMVNIFPRGFDKVREFYAPKYDVPLAEGAPKDLRTTIYWNPSVIVNGQKREISFYNGDRKGRYRVVVEGINADGLLGRQVCHYKVE